MHRERVEALVILSEAKDLLAGIERRKMILRFAQEDKAFNSRLRAEPLR